MKNKSYLKTRRKKSFASLLLAFLLMLTFNSSPIIMISDSLKTSQAYKSSETQTYYSSSESTEEKNFSDANFPSYLSEYFKGSQKNFNIYNEYVKLFNEIYQKKADAFFTAYGDTAYQNSYANFLSHFGDAEKLSDVYNKEKDGSFIKLNLTTNSYQCLAETLASEGFKDYDMSPESVKEISAITNYIEPLARRSDFYRMLADYAINGTLDNGTPEDGADHPNHSIETEEAFYKSNTHYLRLKNYIDGEVAKKFPLHTFDGTTQNANIASIFANLSPTTVNYNYVANSFDRYSAPNATYVTNTVEKVTQNTIYYFGDLTDLANYDQYKKNTGYFAPNLTESSKETVDIFYYKLITSGYGYIDEDHPTYFKYSGTNTPYIKTNSSKTTVFVLNNSATQADLDTYQSVYFTHITDADLDKEGEFFVNIPFEDDEIYFKSIYDNLLHSKKGFDYKTFKDYFTTASGESKLYFKLGSNEYRYVYIDTEDYVEFMNTYPDYKFRDTLKTFDTDEAGYNERDYEIIVSGSSNASYLPKTEEGKKEFKLYFAKEKSYYTTPADSTYGDYEKTFKPVVNLEKQDVPALSYETVSPESSERRIYVLDENNDEVTLNSVLYTCIKQADIDATPNYYVEVPVSLYPNNIDNSIYKLYYKHSSVKVDKVYVVDNADNASDNKIYKTLNYNVIKSIDLENNYSNYLLISEGDVNYNKNFQLYYKYDRTADTSSIYVLKEDLLAGSTTSGTTYKFVGSGELTDYVLIDKNTKPEEYETAKNSILQFFNPDDFHLYYKLSDVFVQNELKKSNAIYVIDTSLSSSDKEDYTQNGYTPISQKDIDNNPGLYVALNEKDPNWRNQKDLKLYYKYIQEDVAVNKVYSYDSIDTSATDYDKKAYDLIPSGSYGYVEGQDNYYKKVLVSTNTNNVSKPAFYYYQTSKTVSLTANSYYVISFYVQTISENDEARASFYIKDTSNVISDIKLENISTNGEWEKYYVYISTNVNTASTVHLYLYLGDEVNGIKGNTGKTEISGSVFFDDIKITKIGLTDYNKFAIDEKLVYSTPLTTGEGDSKVEVPDAYADEYNNRVYIANLESTKASDARFTSNVYEFKNYLDSSNDSFATNWNDMFQFDDANADLKALLGYDSGDEGSTKIDNQLSSTINDDIDGYNMYDSSFTSLWRYYISRDLSNEFSIEKYRQAYKNGKLDVSITNKIDEPEKEEEKEDDNKKEDNKEDKDDILYVSSPFNSNNYALKLKNTHKDISLGITSNSFTVKQFEYYKISLWIYSPDLDGKATLSVNSVMKTRQNPAYGSLLTSSISSTVANVSKSSSKTSEYGWIPVTLFIEGNNYQDMECYLVLSADAESTVYFDNIRIEKTTSAKYDDAQSNSSSNKYTCALSLIPSTSINSTDIKNGSFDYIKETSFDHNVTSDVPYTPDSWTSMTTNSKRVIAGVVSTQQEAFFNKYSGGVIPTEGTDNYSNIYAIYAPSEVSTLHESTVNGYKHNFSIYSGSLSLSSNAIYQISFKFYKGADFSGKLISNIYLSSVKSANIITSLKVDDSDIGTGWQTFTYYLATGSSTSTAYLEIGVENAQGISFIKSVTSKKLTGKTIEGLIADVAKENNIDSSSSSDIFKELKNVKFFSTSNMSFNYHTPDLNDETNMFDQKVFADKTELSSKYTIGQNGVVVAKYFDTNYTTTYTVTINKVTYYIGEVYKATINDSEYFVHKTYNSEKNMFNYTIYSDEDLTNKVTTINNEPASVDISDGVKVKVGESTLHETTTSYRLFKYSDLTEEVRVLDGSTVSVPSLDKVILGSGANAKENTATSTQNTSFEYHFSTSTQSDYVINNTIIPATELDNAQSANVLILSNSYATDYITLTQSSSNTLGKSTYNVLRIYVKTSDFASEDFGLNIKIKAINTEWKNINTTKLENKDKYGFVCYEALIKSNSTDSIADFAVQLSLGSEDNTGSGYAIISEISLTALSSASEFDHYSSQFADDDEFTKKAIYAEKSSSSSDANEDDKDADDENSVSWSTFFYIFSSLLLVLATAVALIAVIIKKHPVKLAQKYSNEHDRDIETVKAKKSTKKTIKKDVVIGEIEQEEKGTKKNEGGIE